MDGAGRDRSGRGAAGVRTRQGGRASVARVAAGVGVRTRHAAAGAKPYAGRPRQPTHPDAGRPLRPRLAYDQWFRDQGLAIRRIYAGNSLVALAALTMAGFGVSYLPTEYFADLVSHGLLQPLKVRGPRPPDTLYHAVHRHDAPLPVSEIAKLAQALCNFEKPKLPRRRPAVSS